MCYDHIYTMSAIFFTNQPKIKSLTQVKGITIWLNSLQLRRSSTEDIFFNSTREKVKNSAWNWHLKTSLALSQNHKDLLCNRITFLLQYLECRNFITVLLHPRQKMKHSWEIQASTCTEIH